MSITLAMRGTVKNRFGFGTTPVQNCFKEPDFYKKTLANCEKVVPILEKITNPQVETEPEERQKTRRKRLRRSIPHKFAYDKRIDDPDVHSFYNEERNSESKEERKASIRDKLQRGQEYLFTELEERDIHERAELYSMSVLPDEDFYIPPNEGVDENDPVYVASLTGQQLAYPLPKKRKRRNHMTDSCYITYHSMDDPFDNSHKIILGSKLLRPPDKLVELVAQAIDGSPDGLLQVPQIYTVLQNKYPYFRYMDRSALGSWRSSVRHALYQKWFRKIRFGTQSITTKGCYWANNHTPNTPRAIPEIERPKRPSKSNRSKSHKRKMKVTDSLEDFYHDPDTHDTILALLNEEVEQYSTDNENFEDMLSLAEEYGIKINNKMYNSTRYSNECRISDVEYSDHNADTDPLLTTYISSDWNISSLNEITGAQSQRYKDMPPLATDITNRHPWSEPQRKARSRKQGDSKQPDFNYKTNSSYQNPSPLFGASPFILEGSSGTDSPIMLEEKSDNSTSSSQSGTHSEDNSLRTGDRFEINSPLTVQSSNLNNAINNIADPGSVDFGFPVDPDVSFSQQSSPQFYDIEQLPEWYASSMKSTAYGFSISNDTDQDLFSNEDYLASETLISNLHFT